MSLDDRSDSSASDGPDSDGAGLDPYRVDPDGLADDPGDWQAVNWAIEGNDLKVPKQPADPRQNAKSNHASTWGAFDVALENATERDDLGIGFPCAQPGHPFLFIDLDTPYGGDWVPSFDGLGGAVVERSPSGNRRLVLRGTDDDPLTVPEWWTNLSLGGENQPEVKLFRDSGYVTLTGDTVDGHGLPLETTHQLAVERWLKDAWNGFGEAFHDGGDDIPPWEEPAATAGLGDESGEGPASEGDGDADEWMTDDDVRDALDAAPSNVHYDTWRNVAYALRDFYDDDSLARKRFVEWSRSGSGWDDASPDLVESFFSGPTRNPGNPATMATVVEVAKRGGWNASTAARKRAAERRAASDDGSGSGTDVAAPPRYPVVEGEDGDVTLEVQPKDGTEVMYTVEQNGERVYSETQKRGAWSNPSKRSLAAGRIADALSGVDGEVVKTGMKRALCEVSADDGDGDLDNALRSPRERALRTRTREVVCYPDGEDTEWHVTLDPCDDSPVEEPRTIVIDADDVHDGGANAFRRAHTGVFFEKVELDAPEWDGLTDYWLDIQETKAPDVNHHVEAAIDSFHDFVNNLQVWVDESGFDWRSQNGLYAKNYREDTDAVLVPGKVVVGWQGRNGFDDVNLSVEGRERGVLLGPSEARTIDETRRSVWVIDAGKTVHTPETALTATPPGKGDESGDTSDDAPRGLR